MQERLPKKISVTGGMWEPFTQHSKQTREQGPAEQVLIATHWGEKLRPAQTDTITLPHEKHFCSNLRMPNATKKAALGVLGLCSANKKFVTKKVVLLKHPQHVRLPAPQCHEIGRRVWPTSPRQTGASLFSATFGATSSQDQTQNWC